MITDFIINLLTNLLDVIIDMLPTLNVPTPDSHPNLTGTIGAFNTILPLETVAQCAMLLITVNVALYGFEMGVWIYHQFWGSN